MCSLFLVSTPLLFTPAQEIPLLRKNAAYRFLTSWEVPVEGEHAYCTRDKRSTLELERSFNIAQALLQITEAAGALQPPPTRSDEDDA